MNLDITLYILFILPFGFAVLFQESVFQLPDYYFWFTASIITIIAAYSLRCFLHYEQTPLFCISSYSLFIFLLIEGLIQYFYMVYYKKRHEITENESGLTNGFFSLITKAFVVGFPFVLDIAFGQAMLEI